jgi:two-component system, cell cycle response regulator
MCMTQLLEPIALAEASSRDSGIVPRETEWTNRISSVMPERAPERIVIVSEDPTSLGRSCLALEQDGYELSYASPESILEIAPTLGADLLLVDMSRESAAALELCRKLRKNPATCHETVVVLTRDESDEDTIAAALLAGADDCIVIGRRTSVLLARIQVQLRNKSYRDTLARVRGERDNFQREASLDPLTHLPNRTALFTVLRRCVERHEPFAVLFLDLDHFKQVNDELGHAMGDEVLRAASACLKQHARNNDCCGRFGGEEFLLLLEGAGGVEALRAAERHRLALESLNFQHARGTARITASVGIAVYDPQRPSSIEDLLGMADAALYEAKRSGRNRSFLAEGAAESGINLLPVGAV